MAPGGSVPLWVGSHRLPGAVPAAGPGRWSLGVGEASPLRVSDSGLLSLQQAVV